MPTFFSHNARVNTLLSCQTSYPTCPREFIAPLAIESKYNPMTSCCVDNLNEKQKIRINVMRWNSLGLELEATGELDRSINRFKFVGRLMTTPRIRFHWLHRLQPWTTLDFHGFLGQITWNTCYVSFQCATSKWHSSHMKKIQASDNTFFPLKLHCFLPVTQFLRAIFYHAWRIDWYANFCATEGAVLGDALLGKKVF